MANGHLRPDRDTEISSYTELLTYNRFDNVFALPEYQYEILVYRGKDFIWKTPLIVWSENGLNKGIRKIELHFKEVPNDLRFVVRVVELSKGRKSQTDTDITSQVNTKSKGKPGSFVVTASIKSRQSFPAISKSSSRSRAAVRRSIRAVPSSGSQRPSGDLPNNRDFNHTKLRIYTFQTPSGSFTGGPTLITNRFQIVSSVRTPNFKALARLGKLPTNPFSFEYGVLDSGSARWNRDYFNHNGGSEGFSYQQWSSNPLISITDVRAHHLGIDENLLIAKLRDRISNGNGFNLAEDLATGSQTLRLVGDNANTLKNTLRFLFLHDTSGFANALGGLSKSRKRGISKALDQARRSGKSGSEFLAQSWIQWRYGWLPLLKDIESGVKTFADYASRGGQVASVSAKTVKVENTDEDIFNGITDLQPLKPLGRNRIQTKTSCQIGIRYRLDNQLLNLASNLGLTSPVSLGWELVPFSFMIDWLLPVGSALQAFSAFEGCTFLGGYKTYFTRKLSTQSMSFSESVPGIANVQLGINETYSGGSSGEGILCTRTVLTDFPGPVKPRFKNPYSAIHAANALALLTLALTKK